MKVRNLKPSQRIDSLEELQWIHTDVYVTLYDEKALKVGKEYYVELH